MAAQDERKKVLDMLAAGQINVDQASELLRALGDAPSVVSVRAAATAPAAAHRHGPAAAHLDRRQRRRRRRAGQDPGQRAPGLAKFASRFLPAEARTELEAQGIDLSELINALSTETPEGKLVDIDVDDDGSGRKKAKIVVEVV
jgi:hypothetical protein